MLQFERTVDESPQSPADIAGNIRSLLLTRGFREDRGDPAILRFRRSTQIATILAFDPARWMVDLELDLHRRKIQMLVHTDGQVITPLERRYFATFFGELVALMRSTSSSNALTVWSESALSKRAARAALSENVLATVGFFLSLPALTLLLHSAMAIPVFWAICWAMGGSMAIAYASLFSVRNRAPRERRPPSELPTAQSESSSPARRAASR